MDDTKEISKGIAWSFCSQHIRFGIEGNEYIENDISLGVIHCYLTHTSWHESTFTLSCESQLENCLREKNKT